VRLTKAQKRDNAAAAARKIAEAKAMLEAGYVLRPAFDAWDNPISVFVPAMQITANARCKMADVAFEYDDSAWIDPKT